MSAPFEGGWVFQAHAYFYSIVTRDTTDQGFAANRQLFLTEQGYRYTILDASQLLTLDPTDGLDG